MLSNQMPNGRDDRSQIRFRLSAQDRRQPIFVGSVGPAAGDDQQREARARGPARTCGRLAADLPQPGRARWLVATPMRGNSIRRWRVDRYAIGAAGKHAVFDFLIGIKFASQKPAEHKQQHNNAERDQRCALARLLFAIISHEILDNKTPAAFSDV